MAARQTLKKLFEPGRIGRMEVRNRIVMPAMVTLYGTQNGHVTQRTCDYYAARAEGGAGLLIVEATYVHIRGRCFMRHLGISDDEYLPGMARLTESIHRHGAKAALQLHHGGRQGKSKLSGLQPVSASAPSDSKRVLDMLEDVAKEATMEDIREIIDSFAAAAVRAKKAGFDAVEIHGAHSYLFSQFLSPDSNKRRDAYGGALRNRARLLLETVAAVRQAVGADFPVWARINATEYGINGGYTEQDGLEVARMVEKAGVDALNVSARSQLNAAQVSPPMWGPVPFEPGALAGLAGSVKKVVGVPVMAVGSISPQLGEQLLQDKKADFIDMGRNLIADPELPNKASSGSMEDIRPCILCGRCTDDLRIPPEAGIKCSVNPRVGREAELGLFPTRKPRKIVVVGSGPAGAEAARAAAVRGHKVTVFEKNKVFGGQLTPAAVAPRKGLIGDLARYYQGQLKKLKVEVRLGQEATAESVRAAGPDAVVVAGGPLPITPEIPGLSEARVVHANDVLLGKAAVGERVVIIGGEIVGCETAEFLAGRGKKVTVTRRGPEMALGVGHSTRGILLKSLEDKGVTLLPGVKYEKVTSKGLVVSDAKGNKKTIEADTVVIAVGAVADRRLIDELQGKVPEIWPVGDCVEPRKIREAITEGFLAACQI